MNNDTKSTRFAGGYGFGVTIVGWLYSVLWGTEIEVFIVCLAALVLGIILEELNKLFFEGMFAAGVVVTIGTAVGFVLINIS